jgi:putative ABC transport system permease protein
LWVHDELQVDKFNQNDSRLHTQEYTPGLLAKALKDEMPEVDYAVSVVPGFGKDVVASGDQQVNG